MNSQFNPTFSLAAECQGHLPLPPDTASVSPLLSVSPMHYNHHLVTLGELDSLHDTLSQLNSEVSYNNSCSSGCTSYGGSPSSLPSYGTQRVSLMQRSLSSHALQKSGVHHPLSALFAELLDSETGPVRRVYSTGDLQRVNGTLHNHQSDSPLSSESSMIIEGMSRASPYSPEEKKVRIERYRSKRNQRNFTKKIKYACRKTLADSRPRIKGRFARNDETEKNPPIQWNHIGAGGEELEDEEDNENWENFLDSLVNATNLDQEPQDTSSFGVFF